LILSKWEISQRERGLLCVLDSQQIEDFSKWEKFVLHCWFPANRSFLKGHVQTIRCLPHRAGATSQTVIAPAPVLNFKLSSGSFWFLFWTPAPGKMPSSYTPAPKPWIWRYFHKNSERNISVVLQAFSSAI